jgi:processive 1,2-diacylglycerol beta-glucosyltransferase
MRVPVLDFIRQDVLPTRFTKTRQLLCSVKPDLVISTHPVSTGIVNNLKRRGHLKCPLWTAFSDWHVQRFWMFPEVTHYLVPLEEQRTELERLGVKAGRVSVVGMLLRKEYYNCLPRTILRSLGKSSRSLLVVGGGKGWALESVLRQLRGTFANVVVITGSNDRKQQIERFLAIQSYGQGWVILGFVDPLPYLAVADLVIAKPGGLSTAEILHLEKPLILVSAMPGHEEENALVLSQYGIQWVKQLEDLPSLVNHYLANGGPKVRKLRSEEFTSPALVFQALQSNFPSL